MARMGPRLGRMSQRSTRPGTSQQPAADQLGVVVGPHWCDDYAATNGWYESGLAGRVHEAQLVGADGSLEAVAQVQLGQHVAQVGADGGLADAQLARDL